MRQLFKAPGVNGFAEAAFLDSLFRGDVFTGEIILFEDLKQMLSRGMFLEMEKMRALGWSSKVICNGLFPRDSNGGIESMTPRTGLYNCLKDGAIALSLRLNLCGIL